MQIDTYKPDIIAIEINNEATWMIIVALNPIFGELSFAENRGRFLVLNYQGEGNLIYTRSLLEETFLDADVMDANEYVPLVLLTQK